MIIGILILAIAGLLAAFSIQNVAAISISLLYWRFETTLPVIAGIAALCGVVMAQLIRQWATRRSTKAGKS